MSKIVNFIKPIIFRLMNSCEVKKMVVELLEKYVKTTDNDVDDLIVTNVRVALLKECK